MFITNEDFRFLKARHVARAKFSIGDVEFDCWEGEWKVSKAGKCVDVFTFRMYDDNELVKLLNELGINTDQVLAA